MYAGPLNEYVTPMEPSYTKDGFGASVVTYTACGRIHAQATWKGGSTHTDSAELFPDGRMEVIVRSSHAVSEGWRLEYYGTLYSVVAMEHNRRRGFKRLICEKVNE